MADRKAEIAALQKDWDTNPRWKGITPVSYTHLTLPTIYSV